jgi:hypothetical protein
MTELHNSTKDKNEVLDNQQYADYTNSDISHTFNKYEWKATEQKLSILEQSVSNSLFCLGSGKECDIIQYHELIGEDLYLANRHLVKDKFPGMLKDYKKIIKQDDNKQELEKNKKKNKKIKTLSSADKIRLENTQRRVTERIKNVLKSFGDNDGIYRPINALKENEIELRGIGLLYCAYFLKMNKINFQKESDLPFILTIMVALQRFSNKTCYVQDHQLSEEDTLLLMEPLSRSTLDMYNFLIKQKSIKSNQSLKLVRGYNMDGVNVFISPTLIADIDNAFEELKKLYEYNGFIIQDYAPELLVYTAFEDINYDKAIPSMGIKPRKTQKEFHRLVSEKYEHGFMLTLKSMIGEGKTSSILSLAGYVHTLKQLNSIKYENTQIIFACNLPSVKKQVGNLCYNSNIKFGVGGYNQRKNKYEVINNRNCIKGQDPLVIITSPEIAYIILKDKNSDNIILFLDEPTVGADSPGSSALYNNMLVLTNLPKRTILASATFPDFSLIQPIINNFINKYPNAYLGKIESNDIQICCDVSTYDHNLVVPHWDATNKEQLNTIINIINSNPFLGRLYSSNVVRTLWETMKMYHIKNIPNIKELFDNVDNMSSNSVRLIAMKLLDLLVLQSDKIIEEVCKCHNKHEKVIVKFKNNITPISQQFLWNSNNIETYPPVDKNEKIDTQQMATTQAWMFVDVTLIASPTPEKFCQDNFSKLVDNIYTYYKKISKCNDGKIITTKDILNRYTTNINNQKKQISKFESSLHQDKGKKSKNTSDTQRDSRDKCKSDKLTKDTIAQKIHEMEEKETFIMFPSFGHINSIQHMKLYSKGLTPDFVNRFNRKPIVLESIPYNDINVPDFVLTLLFAGVGIYDLHNINLCPVYLQTVLDLASNGKLAYICATSSICYGTNYPIGGIYITDDFARLHSVNTLYQLMGRAGRVFKSWKAHAYVSNETAEKIVESTRNISASSIEAKNMTDLFTTILDNINIAQKKKEDELLNKCINNNTENELLNKCINNNTEDELLNKCINNTDSDTDTEDELLNKYINNTNSYNKYKNITKKYTAYEKEEIIQEDIYVPPHMRNVITTVNSPSNWRRHNNTQNENNNATYDVKNIKVTNVDKTKRLSQNISDDLKSWRK